MSWVEDPANSSMSLSQSGLSFLQCPHLSGEESYSEQMTMLGEIAAVDLLRIDSKETGADARRLRPYWLRQTKSVHIPRGNLQSRLQPPKATRLETSCQLTMGRRISAKMERVNNWEDCRKLVSGILRLHNGVAICNFTAAAAVDVTATRLDVPRRQSCRWSRPPSWQGRARWPKRW